MSRLRLWALALAGASGLLFTAASVADITNDSRAGPVNEGGVLRPLIPSAPNASLSEGFEGTFPPTGWIVRNQSTVIGGNATCWNQFTGTTPWVAHTGNGHAGANFQCTTGTNTISGWLITSQLTSVTNGDQVTFWTRKAAGATDFPDRLEVRLCMDTTPGSCGNAGSTGATATDVGNFTTLVLSVNPSLLTNVYPQTYTQFTATISGLPGPGNGRLAFRYFVTNGGPTGANSDLISIDDVQVIPAVLNYSATPSTLTYSGLVGVTSVAQNATIAAQAGNSGPVTFTGCSIAGANAGDFALAPAPVFPLNVAAGTSVNLPVTFTAGATGARTATLTCATSNGTAVGGSFPITLNGTGLALNYAATPATLTYTGVVGITTATQNANIAAAAGNTAAVTFTSCTIAGANAADFALSPAPAFPLNIAAGANVNLPVAFTAGATGARTATLTCATSNGTAVGGSFPITLNGTGTSLNYAVTPSTLTYTGVVGIASAPQNVNIAAQAGNSGPVTFTGCTIGGANPGDFALTPAPSFPLNVAAGANVNLPVTFTAGIAGARSATLTCATSNGTAVGGSFPVTLSGTGTTPILASSPTSGTPLNAQGIVGLPLSRTIAFSNTGTAPGNVSCTASAGFTVSPPTLNLPATSGAGNVTVTASSGAVGTVNGTLTCTRDDGGASFTFPLAFTFTAQPVVPTLSESGLWALMTLIAGFGLFAAFRRRV